MPTSKRLEQRIRATMLLFTAHATYAPCKKALTISLALAAFLYDTRFRPMSTLLPTFQRLIEAGEQRGYWHCDFDGMSGAYLLVIRDPGKDVTSSVHEPTILLENGERKLPVPLITATSDTLASTIAMGADVLFRQVIALAKDQRSYAPVARTQAIPVPYLRGLFEDQRTNCSTGTSSFFLALEEGARRGFWDIVFDASHLCEVVVIR